jgi:hypothetical protein
LDVVTLDDPTGVDAVEIAAARQRGRHVVIDAGTSRPDLADAEHILVVRNCYLALRRAVAMPPSDRVVVVSEPHRALTVADVTALLGVSVVEVPCDDAIARTIDAGLLAARLPRTLAAAVGRLATVEVRS